MRHAAVLVVFLSTAAVAQIPDHDRRLTQFRHTDTEFTNPIPAYDRAEWEARRERLRKQVLFSAGLMPLPPKTALNPEVFGRLDRDGYSIEKVVLQTYPGFYLGGNLYRPRGASGPLPAVVSPHGHWRYGRLENQDLNSVPTRAINLAKQGYVVFTYDMVGYNDTRQFPHAKIGGEREQLWSIGLLGLQLWNSIRAVDFLESLSEVDPNRIGATGASGGATQVMMLSAVDDRIRFSAPVNMISSFMQGGSPCENAANLRIDTNNVEIAALAAPRPLLAVAATGDWTRNVPTLEFPALRRIYELFDAAPQVEAVQFDSPHNYHQGSREAVYGFFGKHALGQSDPELLKEQRAEIEQLSSMLAFWGGRLPTGAVDLPTFIEERVGDAEEYVQQRKPYDRASLARFGGELREWLRYSLLAWTPAAGELLSETLDVLPNGEKLAISRRGKGDRMPAAVLNPKTPNEALKPTLIVHPEGTAWVMSSSVSRAGLVSEILYRGGAVVGVDVFRTGHAETIAPAEPPTERADRYRWTFNRTVTAERVQDVLTAIAFTRQRLERDDLTLYCAGEAGLWCMLARALADGPIDLAADLNGFRADQDDAYIEKLFVPGLRKAGDFRSAAMLWTGGRVLLWNGVQGFPAAAAAAAFQAAGRPGDLDIRSTPMTDGELLTWLSAGVDPQ